MAFYTEKDVDNVDFYKQARKLMGTDKYIKYIRSDVWLDGLLNLFVLVYFW